MKILHKLSRIVLILAAVFVLLFGLLLLTLPKAEHLHVSRSKAIAKVMSKLDIARRDMKDLKTDLQFDGSGDYPCYYIFFTYQDEEGQEVRVCCAVDGETGEYLGLERVE